MFTAVLVLFGSGVGEWGNSAHSRGGGGSEGEWATLKMIEAQKEIQLTIKKQTFTIALMTTCQKQLPTAIAQFRYIKIQPETTTSL